MTCGTYLKEKRLKKKITQAELADRLGLSAQYVGHVENVKVGVPVKQLRHWCEQIGASRRKAIGLLVSDYENKIKQII